MYNLTQQQIAFRATLVEAAHITNFDAIKRMVDSATTVADFIAKLPSVYAPYMNGIATLEGAVDKVLEISNWGDNISYKVVTSIAPPKTKAPKAGKAPKAPAVPAVEGEVATKRRGNPEALKKAREARGVKTPEMVAQDRALVIEMTVAYLKANITPEIPVIHIKKICADVTTALVGKGADGKDIKEALIYAIITETAKDIAITPFVKVQMEGQKIGYQLKA